MLRKERGSKVNVYDFDGTIYGGDSTLDFYKFSLKHNPQIIRFIFLQLLAIFLYIVGIYSKKIMKEKFHVYLKGLNNVEAIVEKFWDINLYKIEDWYLKQKQSDDIINSASPEFIVIPACHRIGIHHIIATQVDPQNGHFKSKNNLGAEKVKRFNQEYPKTTINEFYSDSLSDSPMAELAQKSFFVKSDGNIVKWNEYKPLLIKRLKSMFMQREFIMYIIVGFVNAFNGILFAWLFSLVLQPNISYALGYILSVVLSFFINSILTFKKSPTLKRFFRFILSYLPAFIIQNISVLLFYNILEIPKLFAYIIAGAIGLPVTFLFMKIFTFKK